MGIVKASKMRIDNSDPGVAALRLVNSDHGAKTMTAGISTFQPGASIIWHTHPCEETVIIVDGEATAYIENSKVQLNKFDATIMQPNVPHRFSNESEQPMTIAYFYPIVDAPRYDLDRNSSEESE